MLDGVLCLTSLNIENIRSNRCTLYTDLDHADIVLIQEHWLYTFEQDDILTDLPGRSFCCRSVDEYDPISQINRPQGYGGVATVWKNHLSPFIKKTDEGNERILPILLTSKDGSILIINCYLPSGNSKEATSKFEKDVATLEAIVYKYQHECDIIIGGDLNADLLNRNSRKEQLLSAMMSRTSLEMVNSQIPNQYTFRHKSFKDVTSHLDYFYTSSNLGCKISINTNAATNTSAHLPVELQVSLKNTIRRVPNKKGKKTKHQYPKKIAWNEGDIEKYQESLASQLAGIDIANLTTSAAIQRLQSAIASAEKDAIPSKVLKPIKGPSRRLSPELTMAISTSKDVHFQWKEAGRPGETHPLSQRRKEASKAIRRIQRKEEADKRRKLYDDIMEAHEGDQSTFFRLLRLKHGNRCDTAALSLEGQLTYDHEAQREGWATYFEKLATPDATPNQQTLEAIRWYNNNSSEHVQVQEEHVNTAIRSLNHNKAADSEGIQAEHFKYAGKCIISPLTHIIQKIFDDGTIPTVLKSGFKIPIPKSGKDQLIQSNYRGITITAIFGKILEHIILGLWESSLGAHISSLQFGFEKGKSPTMASLCLTETVAFAKDRGTKLYVATLDAQKAFDVVNHDILRTRLHMKGIQGQAWTLIDDLHQGCSEKVKWKGDYSRYYNVAQGVRQGGVLSTILYKEYMDPLLKDLELASTGAHIGDIYCGTPTCADDVLLIAYDSSELQAMLQKAYSYSRENLYTLHPVKSSTSLLFGKTLPASNPPSLRLGEDILPTAPEFTHLGLTWREGSQQPTVEDRINLAYRSAYLLIGKGIHGSNGINPSISARVMVTQVLPRLIHGLEAAVLSRKAYKALEDVFKSLMRQHQGLPERTATEAVYLLNGTYPVTAYIHYKVLLLFGAICRLDHDHPLRRLAIRQLSLPDSSNSWFVYVRAIAAEYDVDLIQAWNMPWDKLLWKKYTKEAVYSRWHIRLVEAASLKSSLKFLDLQLCYRDKAHPVWDTSRLRTGDTQKAMIRAKLLTGVYTLQTNIHKMKKSEDDICLLCKSAPEDVRHFICQCPALQQIRSPWIEQIIDRLNIKLVSVAPNGEELVKLILNGGKYGLRCTKAWLEDFNTLANNFIYELHNSRNKILLRINTKVVPSRTELH